MAWLSSCGQSLQHASPAPFASVTWMQQWGTRGSPVVLPELACNAAGHSREFQGGNGRELQWGASGSVHPAPPAQCSGALLHQPSPKRKHQRDHGSALSPSPAERPGSARELGTAAGSRSVTEHGSAGTVMAAGSSTALLVLGSAGLGRGHQRTVSTQQPLEHQLPGCPIPSVSSSQHSHHPDTVLAVMG